MSGLSNAIKTEQWELVAYYLLVSVARLATQVPPPYTAEELGKMIFLHLVPARTLKNVEGSQGIDLEAHLRLLHAARSGCVRGKVEHILGVLHKVIHQASVTHITLDEGREFIDVGRGAG